MDLFFNTFEKKDDVKEYDGFSEKNTDCIILKYCKRFEIIGISI